MSKNPASPSFAKAPKGKIADGNTYLPGRGAQINPASKYEQVVRSQEPLDWALVADAWDDGALKTQYLETHPKTILNKVESADIPLE